MSGLRVLVVGIVGYPGGSAAASRLQKIARGLNEAGAAARILAAGRQIDWRQDEHGVAYMTMPLTGVRGSASAFVAKTIALINEGSVDAIYLYGQSWIHFATILARARARSIPVYADLTEWHAISLPVTKIKAWVDQNLFRLRLLPQLAGAIAISRLWAGYVQRIGQRVLVIPALGEQAPLERKAAGAPHIRGEWLVTYVGGLAARDLPETMLDAVENELAGGMRVRLRLVGRPADERRAQMLRERVASRPALAAAVEFTGWVDDMQLQRYLRESNAFLLLRPDGREPRACFPTRLPEYLGTGAPVILSAVGDVGCYLEDRRDAWLVAPGPQPAEVGNAFRHLHSHPAEAARIGAAGSAAGIAHFGFRAHGARLAQFMTGGRMERRSIVTQ